MWGTEENPVLLSGAPFSWRTRPAHKIEAYHLISRKKSSLVCAKNSVGTVERLQAESSHIRAVTEV